MRDIESIVYDVANIYQENRKEAEDYLRKSIIYAIYFINETFLWEFSTLFGDFCTTIEFLDYDKNLEGYQIPTSGVPRSFTVI